MTILDDKVITLLIPLLQTGNIPEFNGSNEDEGILRFIISFLQSHHIAYFSIDSFQTLDISLYGKIIVDDPSPEAVKEKLCWFANGIPRDKKTSSDMLVAFGLDKKEYWSRII
jgi:hypothetical protein